MFLDFLEGDGRGRVVCGQLNSDSGGIGYKIRTLTCDLRLLDTDLLVSSVPYPADDLNRGRLAQVEAASENLALTRSLPGRAPST